MFIPAANMPALSKSIPIDPWLPMKVTPPKIAKKVATGKAISILTNVSFSPAAIVAADI
jgi:hypothetical protein